MKVSVLRRGIMMLLGPVVAASLVVGAPPATATVSTTPDVSEPDSVDVSKVAKGANLPDVGAQSTKTVPLPEVTWPESGDVVSVPVTKGPTGDADPDAPHATTDDPAGAPALIAVESLGKLPDDSIAGLGVAYTITAPPAEDPATADQPSPSPTPTPTPDETVAPAWFTRTLLTAFSAQVAEEITPAPTDPTPSPTEPEPTVSPTTPPDDPGGDEHGVQDGPEDGSSFTSDVEVQFNYADFAGAAGGDWASRLRAVQINDCAPADLECKPVTPLKSTNDTQNQTVTVTVPAEIYTGLSADTAATPQPDDGGVVPQAFAPAQTTSAGSAAVALTAGASGEKGDYSASPLSLSSSWTAGTNSGDFNWTYPLTVTEASTGPTPDLAISYSSGSVDGRTASANNQTTRIGEGFDLDTGFIERSYIPCKDDDFGAENAPSDSTDLCWSDRNLTISLGGKSSKLIDTGNGNNWRMQTDDGTSITRVTGGGTNNAKDSEYWVAVTPDGTTYYFGRNKRFAGDTQPTDSVSTVRVYGNHGADPCHDSSSFADSWCIQGWRWSLDYVVDTNGNTMSLYYQQEENRYLANGGPTRSVYSRGVRLEHIEYGNTTTRDQDKAAAPYRVNFAQEGRCTSPADGCDISDLDSASAGEWPDVPYDRLCYASSGQCSAAPSFFTLYRTSKITSFVRNSANTGYESVQDWTLNHSFPRSGDATDRTLWLSSIVRTSGDVTHPATRFVGTQLDNRVDTTGDSIAPFVKWRVAAIYNSVGGVTSINYNTKDSEDACSWTNKPSEAAPYNNYQLCYLSSYQPQFATDPKFEYFHKYVVDSVVESDQAGRSPNVVTKYTYKGNPAWHFDESNMVRFKYRTWNDWRGYQKVVTEVGGAAQRTWQETLYMRGMDGDRGPQIDGTPTTKSVSIVDKSDDGTTTYSVEIPDTEGTAGFVRRTRTTLGAGGPQIDLTVNHPWLSAMTAGADGQYARHLATDAVDATTTVTGGPDRVTHAGTTFDQSGRPSEVFDDGDVATTSDDQCTKTTYATSGTAAPAEQVATQLTHRGTCNTAVNSDYDVIASTRNYYDNASLGEVSAGRNLTKVETATAWDDQWITTSQIEYDPVGRPTKSTDALGHQSVTDYAVGSDGIITGLSVTNAVGQIATTTVNREWGSPTKTTDVAGHSTVLAYDDAGRVAKIWTPGRATDTTPDYVFTYLTTSTGSHVTTDRLNSLGTTTRSKVFYDGLMRERQTQSTAAGPDGGRLVTENIYDSHGWLESKRGPYFNEQPIGDTIVAAPANSIPSYVDYTYDRSGRTTVEALMTYGKQKSKSEVAYAGTSVGVTPPSGGTATTTTTDARGRTVSLKQYLGSSPTGDADTTTYAYTPAGQLKTVASAGAEWGYEYDIRGRQTTSQDPDKGLTQTTYDDLDRPVVTEDAKQQKLRTTYDALGRKTELRDGDNGTGRLRTSWSYDTIQAGQLSSSTRYVADGDDVHEYTRSYVYDDAGRPTKTNLSLPNNAGLGALYKPDGYTSTASYYDNGSLKQATQPSTTGTGVTNEPLNHTYDNLGNLNTLTGAGALVAGTTYTPFGQVAQRVLGPTMGKSVYDNREYDDATSRLTRQAVSLQTAATATQMDQRYRYDDAGNVTSLDDLPTASGASAFKQCFKYDYLRRMTQAWSSSTTTCDAATPSTLGAQSPYWDRYEYSKSGNRTKWTQVRGAAGTSSTTHTSTYPAPNAPRPHAVATVASTGTSPQTETLIYDNVGNTTTRTGATSGNQTITWDPEGHQSEVTGADNKTAYVYDADGNRLIKKDESTDSTTLYVGNSEYTAKSGNVTLVRNYSAGEGPIATRTASGLTIIVADRNNSGQLAINGASLDIQTRRFTPFGEQLQAPPPGNWPNERGYLNKTTDKSTGTTHLGAREYDPKLGRFLSVDPLLDPMDPQQMNGYAYANNSPITSSDPSGLFVPCEGSSCPGGAGSPYLPKKKPYMRAYHRNVRQNAQNVQDWKADRTWTDATAPAQSSLTPSQWAQQDRTRGSGNTGELLKGIARTVLGDERSCEGGFDWGCAGEIGMALPTPARFAKLFKFGGDAAVAAKTGPALPKALSGGAADTSVYFGSQGGKNVYTGITNNIGRRTSQHGDRFDGLRQITDAPVTRGQARSIEQALIVRNPGFENKINSISPNHAYYNDAVGWGESWLKQNGF